MPAFSQYWRLWNQRYSWQWERLLFIIIQLMQWSSHCVSHKPALIALLDCYISRSQCSIRVAQVSLLRVKAVCKRTRLDRQSLFRDRRCGVGQSDWLGRSQFLLLPPPSHPFRNCLLYADYRTEVYTDDQVIVKITVNNHMETNLKRYGQSGNSKI